METEYNITIRYSEKLKEWVIETEDTILRYKPYKNNTFGDVFKSLFKKQLK